MSTRVQSLVAVFLYVRVFRNCSELKLFCSHYLLTQILGHPPKDPNTDRTLKPLFVWRAAEDLNSRWHLRHALCLIPSSAAITLLNEVEVRSTLSFSRLEV